MGLFKKKPKSVEEILTTFTSAIEDLESFASDQEAWAGQLIDGAGELRTMAAEQEKEARHAMDAHRRALSIQAKLVEMIG